MRLVPLFFVLTAALLPGCANEGVIVSKDSAPLPFYGSLGVDGSYKLALRDSTGAVRSQLVTPEVFEGYAQGPIFQRPAAWAHRGRRFPGDRPRYSGAHRGRKTGWRGVREWPPRGRERTRVPARPRGGQGKSSAPCPAGRGYSKVDGTGCSAGRATGSGRDRPFVRPDFDLGDRACHSGQSRKTRAGFHRFGRATPAIPHAPGGRDSPVRQCNRCPSAAEKSDKRRHRQKIHFEKSQQGERQSDSEEKGGRLIAIQAGVDGDAGDARPRRSVISPFVQRRREHRWRRLPKIEDATGIRMLRRA